MGGRYDTTRLTAARPAKGDKVPAREGGTRQGLADLTLTASPTPNEHRMQGLPRPFAIRSSGFRKRRRALSVACSLWPKRLPAAETSAAPQKSVAFQVRRWATRSYTAHWE